MVTLACAVALAVGVACVAAAVVPRRPSLRAELDDLLGPMAPGIPTVPGFWESFRGDVGAVVSLDAQRFPELFKDLAVMGQAPSDFVRQMLVAGGAFVLLALVGLAALGAGGFTLSPPLGVGLVLLAGGGGAVAPRLTLRGQAAGRRAEMREAVAVICDLAAVLVAAGEDVDAAVVAAAAAGAGWAFEEVRARLPRSSRLGTWVALERLGAELGVDELVVLAQNMGLAEEKGAKVREALNVQAKTLREEAASEVEAKAGSMTERMSFPMVMLLAGFLLVIGYPAVTRL